MKSAMRYPFTPTRMATMEEINVDEGGNREIGILTHC